MEIVVCGSGVGRFLGSRAGSGWLIGSKTGYILFDCGPGVPLRIADNGIDFERMAIKRQINRNSKVPNYYFINKIDIII